MALEVVDPTRKNVILERIRCPLRVVVNNTVVVEFSKEPTNIAFIP